MKDIKKVDGVIQDVKLFKEGETNGRKWAIYNVSINGERFSTFDEQYLGCVGNDGSWCYTEAPSKDGKYVNKTLIDLSGKDSLAEKFKDLESRVKALEIAAGLSTNTPF